MSEGIDVSSWQGNIDYAKVAAAGKKFAIVRGGDGLYRDPRTEQYVAGFRSVGLHIESYHFLRFELSPAQMAGECNRTIERTGGVRFWPDLEDDRADVSMPSIPQRIAWLHDVESRVVFGGMYTGGWWWRPRMANYSGFGHLPLWTAEYPFGNGEQSGQRLLDAGLAPSLYGGWAQWAIWQFGSNGLVDGITENACDLNVTAPGFEMGQEDEMDELTLRKIVKEEVYLALSGGSHYLPDKSFCDWVNLVAADETNPATARLVAIVKAIKELKAGTIAGKWEIRAVP